MTESEITALKEEEASLPSSPPTTTAPEGAPIEEVRAGMHDQAPEGGASYSEEGSLGKELAKEKEEQEKLAKEKEGQEEPAKEKNEPERLAGEKEKQEERAKLETDVGKT